MNPEVHGHRDFYASPSGLVAARLLRERLLKLWPDLTGREILGLGHAAPYLRLWRDGAARILSAALPEADAVPWPPGGPGLCVRVEDEALPFPDLSFDNVLLVHGLEHTENARRMLREVWRVLKDDGRLLVVAPNRRGMWAHLESTPFGQGRPYSPGQLGRLLERNLFSVSRRDKALFMPPFQSRLMLRGAGIWEAAGRVLAPRFAGVVMVEAHKELYGLMPKAAARVPGRRVRVIEGAWAACRDEPAWAEAERHGEHGPGRPPVPRRRGG
ncbi:class I SAM-dependent methyltransferase [Roseomonas sp. M0104]|uniref:Class I SAM-dependent methyltransferase n=1 Tax=Teichococcus coralli TaxID=2545983 RepID=A0A845BBY9_9PROT|nr:class I SAM-dependent methyltransferase [Pseudoroseomonas coralli]MXP63660.1 class I SAM-dependent methyltransferase [Pseudoroseomonas coralli]